MLQHDIETHNSTFDALYPPTTESGRALTIKFHALLHLVSQIRAFGPPRYCWCYRLESMNAPFKKVMRNACNFQNIPLSLATHFQRIAGLSIRCDAAKANYFSVSDFQVIQFSSRSLVSGQITVANSRWANLLLENGAALIERK